MPNPFSSLFGSSKESQPENNSQQPKTEPVDIPSSTDETFCYDDHYTSSEEYGISPDTPGNLDDFLSDTPKPEPEPARQPSHEFTPDPVRVPDFGLRNNEPTVIPSTAQPEPPTFEENTEEVPAPEQEEIKEEKCRQEQTPESGDFTQIAGVLDAMFEKIEGFQTAIGNLQTEISMLNEDIEKKEAIIRNKDMQVERLQKFMTSREKHHLYKMIIEYVDRLTEILESDDKMSDMDPETRHSELLNNVEMFQQAIIGDLENENIFQFRDTQDDPVNFSQGRQTVIDRDESDNENEFLRVGSETYFRPMRPGYTILAPNMAGEETETVLRREEVIKMVLRKND